MDEIEELRIERDKLREETRGKEVSSWKFWQFGRDHELIRKCERICDINNILSGVRLQLKFAKEQ